MRIIISSCQYHESVGNFHQADINDKALQKIAKTLEGEPIVEKLDWVNPSLRPKDVSKMEADVYPPDFHLFTDLEIPSYLDMTPEQQRLIPKPVRDRIIREIRETAEEHLIEDNRDKYIVDGINGIFYFILSVNNRKKKIEVEDLTVIPGNRKTNLMIALDRLYKLLMPYQSQGFSIIGSARKTTSWPMIKNMVKQGWLIPVQGKRIKKVFRDDQGRVTDMNTRMDDIGDEELHEFEFQLNLPSALPDYIQKAAAQAYEKLNPKKTFVNRGVDKLKSLFSK
jgi:hypothetical protein